MATKSKLELAVDAGKWEDGLRKAQNSMKAFEDSIGGLEKATSAEKEQMTKFIQLLGNTKSTAATTAQQVKEYRSTIERLQVISEKLNGEQKKLAEESMAKLTKKMQEAKQKADQLNQSMNGTANGTGKMNSEGAQGASILDRLAGKFGISGKEAIAMGAAVAGTQTAIKVASDAFLASDSNIDEWGRIVREAETTYESFLTSLNTGDISSFLSRIDHIVESARTAYNELDRLSTQKAINNKAYQEQNVENERFRAMLRTGRYIAPNDGRAAANGLKDGDKLSKEQLESIANDLKSGLKRTNEIVRDEIKQTTKSIGALYDEQASVLGTSKKAFMDATKDMDSFDDAMRKYNAYLEYENKHTTTQTMQSTAGAFNYSVRDKSVNPYEAYKWVGVFKDAGEKFNQLNQLINQRAALQTQNYNNIVQAYRGINKTEGGSGGGKTTKQEEVFGAGEVGSLEKQIQDLQKAQKHAASTEEWKAYEEQIKQINAQIDFLKTGIIQLPTIKPKFDKAASDELKREIQSAGIFSTSSLSALKSSYQDTANNAQIGSRQQTDATAMVADITAFENIRAKFQELGMQMGNDVTNNLLQKIGSGEGVEDADWQTFIDTLNAKIEEIGGELQPIKLDVNTGNIENVKKSVVGLDKNVNGVATAFTAMGNALNQIEDPGAKVAGYIASAIGQTAAAFGTAQTQAATMGPWAWIAFAATGLATMVSTIVGIKNATKFADGGLVKGTSYVGDKVPIMANAGELVLSASMQQNLADNLEARELTTGGESIIRGEDLVTIINNYGRRSGRGEILR